jgi:hypothetical protein
MSLEYRYGQPWVNDNAIDTWKIVLSFWYKKINNVFIELEILLACLMSNLLSQIKCVPLQVFDFDLSEDEMSQITTLNKDYRLSTEDM